MFSKNDLIYLGTILLASGDVSRNGVGYVSSSSIICAQELAEQLYKKIFGDDSTEEKMILE